MTLDKEKEITIALNDSSTAVLGRCDENLRKIQQNLKADIFARGDELHISGSPGDARKAEKIFLHLQSLAEAGVEIDEHVINYSLASLNDLKEEDASVLGRTVFVTHRGKQIKGRTVGQCRYVELLDNNDVVFAIGPAGTGKTYLAVVKAVAALKNKDVRRIVLTRPAVEAGEKLGFLPGDLQDKVDPYLRPLYDALFDVLGSDAAQRLMDKGVIEIAPLAYMRGRTLDDAFIILDEAQNTTCSQMKMFLTRMGFGSRMVITGDITQIDLAKGEQSGLVHARKILKNVHGIGFAFLTHMDIVRHPLVQKIIDAYERFENHDK